MRCSDGVVLVRVDLISKQRGRKLVGGADRVSLSLFSFSSFNLNYSASTSLTRPLHPSFNSQQPKTKKTPGRREPLRVQDARAGHKHPHPPRREARRRRPLRRRRRRKAGRFAGPGRGPRLQKHLRVSDPGQDPLRPRRVLRARLQPLLVRPALRVRDAAGDLRRRGGARALRDRPGGGSIRKSSHLFFGFLCSVVFF